MPYYSQNSLLLSPLKKDKYAILFAKLKIKVQSRNIKIRGAIINAAEHSLSAQSLISAKDEGGTSDKECLNRIMNDIYFFPFSSFLLTIILLFIPIFDKPVAHFTLYQIYQFCFQPLTFQRFLFYKHCFFKSTQLRGPVIIKLEGGWRRNWGAFTFFGWNIHRIHKWRPRGTTWFRMHENEAWQAMVTDH